MKIRRILLISIAILSLLVAFSMLFVPSYFDNKTNTVIEHEPYSISAQARELHQTLDIGDWHADTAIWPRDLLERSSIGHIDIPRMREGNVAVQMFTSFTKVPAGLNYKTNSSEARDRVTPIIVLQAWPIDTWTSLTARALHIAGKLQAVADKAPEQFQLIRSSEELRAILKSRAKGSSIVAGILGTEGSHALDGKLENIDVLYNAGYRMMSLQHFFDNALGGSLHGESGAGLTEFGRKSVSKMLKKGIMIDVSHSSVKVVEDVLAMTKAPLIVSHTGLYGHCQSPRNISDALMKRIAKRGGIIGIGYWDAAVCEATPKSIVAAIRYGIDLLGVDHIALGSDFDGAINAPFDTSELAVITEEMLKANFTELEIRKVMGGNMMRYLNDHLPAY